MKGLTYKIEKSLREKKIEIDELNTTIWKVWFEGGGRNEYGGYYFE